MSLKKVDEQSSARSDGRNCVMAYGYDEIENDMLKFCLETAKIEALIVLKEADTHRILKTILEEYPAAESDEDLISEGPFRLPKTLVFSGTSDEELYGFIKAMRAIGVESELKAVITAHNIDWAFDALVEELIEENRALQGEK